MTYLIYLLVVGFYIWATVRIVKESLARQDVDFKLEIMQVLKPYNKLLNKKEALYKEKMALENEAIETFALYEITKEIVYSLSDEEAFKIFKRKLKEHVAFEECRFLYPNIQEIREIKKDKEFFIFPLKTKKKRIGYLVVKGVSEKDKEKVMILGHQFALALRRVNLYEEIEKTAITDSLTSVHTRRYILDRFDEELKRSKVRKINMSFIIIDVDNFKSYNDHYGHLTGDQILREVGSIIKENIREIDIAARYGGEEFCVILPDTDKAGAHYAAERIRVATEREVIKAYDATVKVTISAGTSTFPDDGVGKIEMIDKADWGLYRAKKSGRNRVCSFSLHVK